MLASLSLSALSPFERQDFLRLFSDFFPLGEFSFDVSICCTFEINFLAELSNAMVDNGASLKMLKSQILFYQH